MMISAPEAVPRPQTDMEPLVRAAQRGESRAFAELVRRYEARVYRTGLRWLGSDAEAQELRQEVFAQAFRKLEQLEEPRAFGSWLQTIARRLASNRRRRGQRFLALEPAAAADRCLAGQTPLDGMLARERRDQVREGLGRLSDLDRRTLVAFYFEGHSLARMAAEFCSPVGTIKRRLCVARRRLRKHLETLAVA